MLDQVHTGSKTSMRPEVRISLDYGAPGSAGLADGKVGCMWQGKVRRAQPSLPIQHCSWMDCLSIYLAQDVAKY